MAKQITNKSGTVFKPGDDVCLTGQAFRSYHPQMTIHAKIDYISVYYKGYVVLDTRLGGYFLRDVNDLQKLEV